MSGFSSRKSNRTRGFTLVELLVAISIVAILGAMVLGVAATATGTAREAKTKATVSRLHSLLMERYDLYRTRRVEIDTRDLNSNGVPDSRDRLTTDRTGIVANLSPLQLNAAVRVAALREMMKVEMPDRWSDLLGAEVPTAPVQINARSFLFLSEAPALWHAYTRAYNQAVKEGATREELLTNQSAECLYLIVMNATGDGEAPGLFQESDIGDTDEDGLLEFLDGWGNPITYIRWAPGYESDAQLSVPGLQQTYRRPPRGEGGVRPQGNVAVIDAILEDHDPYDLFRLDVPAIGSFNATTDDRNVRGWRLVPLIVSAGPDEEFGLWDGLDLTDATNPTEAFVAAADPYGDTDTDSEGIQRLGSLTDPDLPADNIHNHTLGSLVRTQ